MEGITFLWGRQEHYLLALVDCYSGQVWRYIGPSTTKTALMVIGRGWVWVLLLSLHAIHPCHAPGGSWQLWFHLLGNAKLSLSELIGGLTGSSMMRMVMTTLHALQYRVGCLLVDGNHQCNHKP